MAASKSANNSPQVGSKSSPQDTNKKVKVEDTSSVSKSEDTKPEGDDSNKTSTTNAEPLGPPAKPNTSNADGGDYFSNSHNGSTFNLEPNPFEQSFGNPSAETPGKNLLPSVASLTSPSSLLPGGTPSWGNSLRSGPLSPAMLAGPTGNSDYFGDSHFRGGFPTPNESSLRTGLTPGGTGSMFPAASPGSQAFLQSLQGGGATPGTLDFHRTAMAAAAKSQQNNNNFTSNGQTSQPQEGQMPQQQNQQQQSQQQNNQGDSYHDANDAANGLFMLAQANGARNNNSNNNNNQFAVPGQPAQGINTSVASSMGGQSQETSPISKRGKGSIASAEGAEGSEEDSKPATRSSNRNKKGGNTKPANNRRKAEEPPAKGPVAKKPKSAPSIGEDDSDDDEPLDPKVETHHPNGKKMTDEEKRKNFLERNRVAALKCRQRKKQWLASLQAKVEYYTAENEALNGQLGSLREEVMNLKTLLLAHKDCPITQQQGLNGMALANLLGDPNQHAHPYGMGMHNGMPPNSMPPQGFSMPPAPPAGMHRR